MLMVQKVNSRLKLSDCECWMQSKLLLEGIIITMTNNQCKHHCEFLGWNAGGRNMGTLPAEVSWSRPEIRSPHTPSATWASLATNRLVLLNSTFPCLAQSRWDI